MKSWKCTYCSRLLGSLLCLFLFAQLTITKAHAQLTAVLHGLQQSVVDNPRYQYFPFTYDTAGSSIWGPGVPGTQQVDFAIPLVSPDWNQTLGYFFDPCIVLGCTFGAGFRAGVTASTNASFHAKADLGSVDLHCPGGVGIDYPEDSAIKPGQPFTIQTYCIVDQTAFMNINAAHLSLSVNGRMDAKMDFAFVAKAAGKELVNENLFHLLKLDAPSFSREQEVFNTGNWLQSGGDYPLPIPPYIGTGFFHVPYLGARGTLRNDKLKARASDNFLTFHADLTNMLLQYFALGIPIPLNGDYDYFGFNFHFHLLDLQLQADAKIRQDFTFDPRPWIQFKATNGKTYNIQAGDSVTFTAPASTDRLSITPTIVYNLNSFSDDTVITVDPSLAFNLLKVKGGGRVLGHDLFSFNLNPFGTQTVGTTFVVPLFQQSFALPSPSSFVCPPFVIGASATTATSNFDAITREVPTNGTATIAGHVTNTALNGSSITLTVQGAQQTFDIPTTVDENGFFSVDILEPSRLGRYRPITVSGVHHSLALVFDIVINPVTIYWPRPALTADLFDAIAFDPTRVPGGQLVAYTGTGKFTVPLHSFNVAPDATLLYDDIPIVTSIQSDSAVSDGFLVTGEVRDFLMDLGGSHTLSFINSGLNQKPVLLQTFVVNNAAPTLTDVVKGHSPTDNSPLLIVRGDGFTLDTTVQIGNISRPALLVSRNELQVSLLSPDCLAGIHPVTVSSPAPGGGSVTAAYEVAPTAADIPHLVAAHSLLRHEPAIQNEPEGDTVADLITLTNAGKNDLGDVVITSVKLLVNGKAFTASGTPSPLPLLVPGGYCSVQVILPPHSSVAGDTGILQVRGTVHGKAFVLSNRVIMPAPYH